MALVKDRTKGDKKWKIMYRPGKGSFKVIYAKEYGRANDNWGGLDDYIHQDRKTQG